MRCSSVSAWVWVPSSYFAEGLPYNVVNTLAVVMLADLTMRNSLITLTVSLLSLPWSLKALWSPWVDIYATKRRWLLRAQTVCGLCLVGTAAALLLPGGTSWLLLSLALAAFSSATYDIACDGFYMQALSAEQQSYFVGIRSTAYRISTLFTGGALIYAAGWLQQHLRLAADESAVARSWSLVFLFVALLLLGFAALHAWLLPRPEGEAGRRASAGEELHSDADVTAQTSNTLRLFWEVLKSFFTKRDLLFMLLFLIAYRLGEALLAKVTCLFLIDDRAHGGLGLDTTDYGLIYGVAGVASLLIGGILGGMFIARRTLRRSVLWMALALNVPDLLYVWMAYTQPDNLWLIGAAVAVEQFGYGFGLTAYMVYMLQSVKGCFATSHYAFLTCIMALGLMLPGLVSGALQEALGYPSFFWLACLATLPGFAASLRLARG
jgi:PAT family beta-lactamase induction signal transducer AmpG